MATGVDMKLLKQTKFPAEFSTKVDMKKVNVEVMKKWIAGRISDILGSEDDVVIELCFNLLEGERFPDIKKLQIQLTGFLDKDTPKFCKELWNLCLSAQNNPQGVPQELLEAKKLELIQEKIAAEKAAEEAQRRKEQERQQVRNLDSIRQRERGERGRGRGRGGRGSYDYGGPPPRRSRTPPRRRSPLRDSYRAPPPRREIDTYMPSARDRRRPAPSHSPSHSRKSRSMSKSPPPRSKPRYMSPRDQRRYHSPTGSLSRSPSPDRPTRSSKYVERRTYRGDRRRSYTPSYSSRSRSRSPRRYRRRSPSLSSRSRTPSRKYKSTIRRNTSSPESISRSRSLSRTRRPSYKSRRSPSYSDEDKRSDTRTNGRKGYKHRNDRRRTYSPSPSPPPRRRRSYSRSPNPPTKHRTQAERSPSPPPRKEILRSIAERQPGRLSRSPTPDKYRERKRHRSIQRYDPAARRGHPHSSVSPESNKRRRVADDDVRDDRRGANNDVKANRDPEGVEEVKPSAQSSTELREKLLKEKALAMRRPISSTNEARAALP